MLIYPVLKFEKRFWRREPETGMMSAEVLHVSFVSVIGSFELFERRRDDLLAEVHPLS
jgi:hypothetical protein